MKMIRHKVIEYTEEIPNTLEKFKDWEFSSGGITGEDFRIFSRKFRSFVKKNIPPGAELVKFTRGHYFLSGFIKKENKFVYFSISDVRYFKNEWAKNILIRTAISDRDYTGGPNDFTTLEDFKKAVKRFL